MCDTYYPVLNTNYRVSPTLAHSFDENYLRGLNFAAEQLATIQRLGEYRGRQDLFSLQVPEQLEALKDAASTQSTESSNRIEGVVAPPARIEALVQQKSEPRNRPEQEIAGYRDALALIHESYENMPFTGNVILQLHGYLFRYLPGEGGRWKSTDNQIVERGADGRVIRVRFTATPAVATPAAIEDLATGHARSVDELQLEPLIATGLAVLDFLCIHPFRDGNGRMARLLTLLLLYRSGYRVGRYVSLERIIEESRETYYESLEESSRQWHEGKHDVMPWLNYFWGTLIRAYSEFEERVIHMVKGRGSKTDMIREAVTKRFGPFSMSDIEADCPGVSRDMVRHVLRRLKTDGVIRLDGRGRGAKWRST